MSALVSIAEFSKSINLAGIETIEYLPIEGVNESQYELLISSANNFQKAIVLNAGYAWLKAPVVINSKDWSEIDKSTKQATMYEQTIVGIVPKLRPDVVGEFAKMKDRGFLVKLTDLNSQPWLIGTLESPLLFLNRGTTGKQTGNLNNYQIEFSGMTANPAFGYVPVI